MTKLYCIYLISGGSIIDSRAGLSFTQANQAILAWTDKAKGRYCRICS